VQRRKEGAVCDSRYQPLSKVVRPYGCERGASAPEHLVVAGNRLGEIVSQGGLRVKAVPVPV
jgi:hypothetical protein